MTTKFETCCRCESSTGRAGRGEDSIYCPTCDTGPFCEECAAGHDDKILNTLSALSDNGDAGEGLDKLLGLVEAMSAHLDKRAAPPIASTCFWHREMQAMLSNLPPEPEQDGFCQICNDKGCPACDGRQIAQELQEQDAKPEPEGEVCSECKGRRWVEHESAKGVFHHVDCPHCSGTGREPKEKGIRPTEKDIGRSVLYIPTHAHGDRTHRDVERGTINSIERSGTVFVRYGDQPRAKGTYATDLEWETP